MRTFICSLFTIFSLFSTNIWAQNEINEFKLKTSLIFRFGENIFWPDETKKDTFVIGVIDNTSKLLPYLARAAKYQKIKKKKVVVRVFKDCFFREIPNIIYVSPKFNSSIKRLRKLSYGFPILIVTEDLSNPEDMMINFFHQNDRILFQVNTINLLNQKLVATASLLLLGANNEDILSTYKQIDSQLKRVQEKMVQQSRIIEDNRLKIEKNKIYASSQKQKLDSLKKLIVLNSDSLLLKEILIIRQKKAMRHTLDLLDARQKLLKKQLFDLRISKFELAEKQKEIFAFNEILKNSRHLLDQRNKELNVRNFLIEKQKRGLKKTNNQHVYYWFLLILFFCTIILLLVLYISQLRKKSRQNILDNQNLSLKRALSATQDEVARLNLEKKEIQEHNLVDKEKLVLANLYTSKVKQLMLGSLKRFDYIFENFNIFLSKENNSSDFFFFMKFFYEQNFEEKYIIGMGDTHHYGIPATQISLFAHQQLKELLLLNSKKKIAEIVNLFDETFTKLSKISFVQSPPKLDISVFSIEKLESNKIAIHFVGVNLPTLLYRKEEKKCFMTQGINRKIGNFKQDETAFFSEKNFVAESGDVLYFFTDGFLDINSADRDEALVLITKLINRIAILPMEKQKEIILSSIRTKLNNSPIQNDISIVGILL